MQIDLFTLVAEIANFLILVFLLRKFLYQPVIDAMNAREEKIASQLKRAEAEREEAEEQKQDYLQKKQELEEQRREKIKEINQEVETRQKEMLEEARKQVANIQEEWEQQILSDQKEFLQSLRKMLNNEVFSILRKIMKDMANASLEKEIIKTFAGKVEKISEQKSEKIVKAFSEAEEGILVESGFELTKEQKSKITQVIQQKIFKERDITIRYNTSKELIAGIELQVNNYHLGWTITDYLDQLQERIRSELDKLTSENLETEELRNKV